MLLETVTTAKGRRLAMAIIKSAVKLIIREHGNYSFSGPALTLGIPEIYATHDELNNWFPNLMGQPCNLKLADVSITTNDTGRRLGWVSAETFFRSLGIPDVTSVDIPGCEHQPDLIHDLNDPFPQHFSNRFNLVIDPGTIEHVFDIKTGLSNIVRALKVGGVIIQQVPVYSYNGGYYSINPNLLNDFYAANGFDELKTYIIMWDRYHAYTGQNRCYEYSEQLLGFRHAIADYDQCRFSPHMLFFARKKEELLEIRIPLQFEGHYVGNRLKDSPSTNLLSFEKLMSHERVPKAQIYP
jgi:SAM-dependent methyltransferase